MNKKPNLLENLLRKVNDIVDKNDLVALKDSFRNICLETLKKLDLVTIDEFNTQTEILDKLINKITDLSLRIDELEKRISELEKIGNNI